MKTIAIIPARGGSKGIPRKNLVNVAGKPMLGWTIEAAKSSRLVDAVYVSTEDLEIADVAREYGAQVVVRPKELASDTASSEGALLHALEVLKRQGVCPELIVFMQCTSPLIKSIDVDKAVGKLINENADSCFTVTDSHCFLWKKCEDGSAMGLNHDKSRRLRRQDIDAEYSENGAVYVMKVLGFEKGRHRFFGKTVMSVMPKERSIDVDDVVDLTIAEALLKKQSGDNYLASSCKLPSQVKAVLFDFDGVFTNNKVYLNELGLESVRCDRSDGWGISQLKKKEIKIGVLSTEINPVVSARCKKLGIECCQGLGEKKYEAFKGWCVKNGIKTQDVVFVGNDQNDVECLIEAGCGIVPSDAYAAAIEATDLILNNRGGNGAVREVCEMILGLFEQ